MSDSINGLEPMDRQLQSAAVATGNGNNIELNGRYATTALQITGTFVGTVTYEGSVDGTNFVSILSTDATAGTTATTATAPAIVSVPSKGLRLLRARISAYTSGSITVTATAVPM